MKKNLFKRITSLTVAGALAAMCLAGCGEPATPMEAIENGFEKLLDNAGGSNSIMETLAAAGEKGSVEVKMGLGNIIAEATGMELDIGASVTTYVDKDKAALKAAASYEGVPVVDALLYFDENKLAVKSDAFTGGVAYGTAFEGFIDRFNNSAFAGDGAYAVTEKLELNEEAMGAFDSLNRFSEMYVSLDTLAKGLKDEIYAAVESNSVNSIADGKFTVAGTEIDADVVSIVFDGDKLCDFVIALADIIGNSAEVKAFCEEYKDLFADIYDVEDVYAALTERIAELKSEVSESYGEMAGNKLELLAYINSSTDELIGMELNAYVAEETDDVAVEEADVEADATASVASEKMPLFKFAYGPSGENFKEFRYALRGMEICYTVTEDSDAKYAAKLGVSSEYYILDSEDSNAVSDEMVLLEYTWDKTSGDYALTLVPEMEMNAGINGNISAEKDTVTFTVDNITYDGETLELEDFAVIITAGAEVPTIDEYTDVLTMTDEEITAIINAFSENFGGIMSLAG